MDKKPTIETDVWQPLFSKDNLRLWKETDGNYHATNADGNIVWIDKSVAEDFANSLLKDVTKGKPEIKPCPNPECGNSVYIESIICDDERNNRYFLTCDSCDYQSPHADSESEATRLHNLLCGKVE